MIGDLYRTLELPLLVRSVLLLFYFPLYLSHWGVRGTFRRVFSPQSKGGNSGPPRFILNYSSFAMPQPQAAKPRAPHILPRQQYECNLQATALEL